MVLLGFLTSYNQQGTPSPNGLVDVKSSAWLGSGVVLTVPQQNGYFAALTSGVPSGGINFASSQYYVPSGGFANFNISSGLPYGSPFGG